ncbi:Na+ dependent nucleoside transporter C-terminus-domain-containing protein [Jimgerdemannia flammicorona]|uniref:Na+ dependent nucleoside transporter C-terminus-domain-containing protein n=1 Tax=Jimgerdemannia flammicorona TaxID=994334 RepID=A0A433QM26_9FUNG|nr:Na+ dependent nucleoside transporter C-terminus-domain-containing protein [Jimgerdemannia flammicorona]
MADTHEKDMTGRDADSRVLPTYHVESPIEKINEEGYADERNIDEKNIDALLTDADQEKPPTLYRRFRPWIHLLEVLIFTGFLIAAYIIQIPKGYNQELLVLGIIWLFTVLKLFFFHVKPHHITHPVYSAWQAAISRPVAKMEKRTRDYAGITAAVALVLIIAFVPAEDLENGSSRLQRFVSLFGMVVFLTLLWATSNNRRAIQWRTVVVGILAQFILGLFVLRTSVGYDIFAWFSAFVQTYLGFSKNGVEFVFGATVANYGSFAVAVFPAIMFFCSTAQVLNYFGVFQWTIKKFATFFVALMGTSGAESIVAAASPFIGQGESAILVSPFVAHMTKSEIHQIMTSGFATISGSVLFGYISLGVSGQALLTAAIMSIPCALALSKMRYPETEESLTKGRVEIVQEGEREVNFLHAAGNGAAIGLTIAGLIMVSLICIIALLAAFNAFLTWIGNFINIEGLTLTLILGYIFVPFAWLIGIPGNECVLVGQLLANKLVANEFVAYSMLTDKTLPYIALSTRSKTITTYALAGFANLGSVGIQIGTLGSLAPLRKKDVAEMAISAMLTGALSTCFTASIAGMLL